MIDCNEQAFKGFSWGIHAAFTSTLRKCRFERGDLIYAKEKSPQKAPDRLRLCIQVRAPAQGVGKATDEAGVFEMNWRSPVEFWLFKIKGSNYYKVREVTTTQGRLYMLLWKGDWKVLQPERECPTPATCLEASRQAETVAEEVKRLMPERMTHPNVWVMGYDPTNSVSLAKYKLVSPQLRKEFSAVERIFRLEEVGLQNAFVVPTFSFAGFVIDESNSLRIAATLKTLLYNPSANRKSTEGKFRLSAHGAFLPWQNQNWELTGK